MSAEIIRLAAVCQRVGLSKTTVYQKIKKSEFPAPLKLGKRAVGFLVADVEKWITSRERTTQAAQP